MKGLYVFPIFLLGFLRIETLAASWASRLFMKYFSENPLNFDSGTARVRLTINELYDLTKNVFETKIMLYFWSNAQVLVMPIFNNCCSVMRVSPEEATEQCHIESLGHNGHICRLFFNKMRVCALEMMLAVCDTWRMMTFMSKKIIWLHQQWNKENFPTPLSWCLFITDDFPSQAFPHSWNASRGPEMILHKSPHVPFRQN